MPAKLTIEEKKKELRDKIIRKATIIFEQFGFKKTTMNIIAQEIGKGKSSIYYYFQSKEEIFQAVVLNEAIIYRRKIITAINKSDDPFVKLKNYVITRLLTIDTLTNFRKALEDRQLMHIDFVVRLKKLYDKEEIRLFENILKQGVQQGYFQEIYDINLAAVAIVMAMRGMDTILLLDKDDPNLHNKVNDIIDIILYGIVKR